MCGYSIRCRRTQHSPNSFTSNKERAELLGTFDAMNVYLLSFSIHICWQGAWLRPCYRVHFPFRKYESDINQNVTNCQPKSFVCPDFCSNLCLMITIARNQHGKFMKSVLNRKGWWQYLTNKLIPLFEVKLLHLFLKEQFT